MVPQNVSSVLFFPFQSVSFHFVVYTQIRPKTSALLFDGFTMHSETWRKTSCGCMNGEYMERISKQRQNVDVCTVYSTLGTKDTLENSTSKRKHLKLTETAR